MTSLRFQPQPASDTGPAGAEFDALADLFLDATPPVSVRFAPETAQPESRETVVPAAPTTPEVEALILGHLPVFGSAWVTQYAKSVAERSQKPVALLRVQAGETWLDLVLPRGQASPVRSRSPFLAAVSPVRRTSTRQTEIPFVNNCATSSARCLRNRSFPSWHTPTTNGARFDRSGSVGRNSNSGT